MQKQTAKSLEGLSSTAPQGSTRIDPHRPPQKEWGLFSEHSPENLKLLSDELLRPMAHLMIDEFQDVSPQIVSWIRASLNEIRSRGPAMHIGRGAQRSSLLCVGDDWQSIYGWRGSSPSYFMEFNKQFPSPSTTRVMLSDNYRSH